MPAILGKKLGMTQIFTEEGDRVPVTVIEAGPCTVTQVKTADKEGYTALQLGFAEVKERRVNKPLAGHFKKAGVKPLRYLAEVRIEEAAAIDWILPAEEAGGKKAKEKKKAKAKEEKETRVKAAEAAEGAPEEAEGTEATAAEGGEGEKAVSEAEAEAEEAAGAGEEQPQAGEAETGAVRAGSRVTVQAFAEGQKIKVRGVSKGKGFAGVIKRHGFAGGPGSHGAHFHRAPGSVGASAYPSRVFKGLRLPGQMGNKKCTQRGLTVFKADIEKNLLFVRGSVPGSNNDIVFIQTES